MRSKKDKNNFLEKLAITPIVSIVCRNTNISKATIYRWIDKDKEFAKSFNTAMENGRDTINDLAESQIINSIKKGEKWAVDLWLVNNHKRYHRPKKALSTDPVYKGVAQILYEVVKTVRKEHE